MDFYENIFISKDLLKLKSISLFTKFHPLLFEVLTHIA